MKTSSRILRRQRFFGALLVVVSFNTHASADGVVATSPAQVADKAADDTWWSLKPVSPIVVPSLSDGALSDGAGEEAPWGRTPIDSFIARKLREHGLTSSPQADRRVLIRRLYFDLVGLPPRPEAVDAFVRSEDPAAYEKLVDELLASPHHGERWARHWLDVVHYADSHGYDKDKPREHAWPYRDYLIRSFNQDKPYTRFVEEQLAGDVLYPGTLDGIEAMGFVSAGPWDFIGHVEVAETKFDGQVARNLDRDDMVSTTMNVFSSMTVQCARCHDHKFDPVSQEEYYSLQAVFAAIDRARKPYDRDRDVATRRHDLSERQRQLWLELQALEDAARSAPQVVAVDERIGRLLDEAPLAGGSAVDGVTPSEASGIRTWAFPNEDAELWVRAQLESSISIDTILLFGAPAEGIPDYGFPRRFTVEVSEDKNFEKEKTEVVLDHTHADFPRPGAWAVKIPAGGVKAQYLRVNATRLWRRPKDSPRGVEPEENRFLLAIGEIAVISGGKRVPVNWARANETFEEPPRWTRANAHDGVFGRYRLEVTDGLEVAEGAAPDREREAAQLLSWAAPKKLWEELSSLSQERAELLDAEHTKNGERRAEIVDELAQVKEAIAALPPQDTVYVGTVHRGDGKFRGRFGLGPRPIHVLQRGDVRSLGKPVGPGTVDIIEGVSGRFELPSTHEESQRRIALACWLTDKRHPLTWRSIVNRVWHYHFGRGIVDSPNDLGRMGQLPTHPELLDWLALEFRDGGRSIPQPQSLKALHKLIVMSSVYRQESAIRDDAAAIDGSNQYLWRVNRRRLDAESIRDSVLLVSGMLDKKMYGPGFKDFVLEKPEHSPHYEYHKHDPDDRATHRRSVYRFLARSQPDPFMETLDCADPSQMVAKRNETLTSLQALALLNNKFMLRMAEHFALRVAKESEGLRSQVGRAYLLATGRASTAQEAEELVAYAEEFGLANVCRVILNLNEFVFVD